MALATLRQSPREAGLATATWTGKAVAQYVAEQFQVVVSHAACRRYLHRLGFVRTRPKKQLVTADPEQRETVVRTYADLMVDATRTGATIWFVDEAHFRADAEPGWRWTRD